MAKKAPKADKNEQGKRIRAVQEWILQGQYTRDIISQICSLWELKERAAYNLYSKAWTDIQKVNEANKEKKIASHIQMRMKLYRDLKEKDTPSGARAALRMLDSIARIEGLIPIRENQSGFGGGDFGDEDDNDDGATMKLSDGTEIEI